MLGVGVGTNLASHLQETNTRSAYVWVCGRERGKEGGEGEQ